MVCYLRTIFIRLRTQCADRKTLPLSKKKLYQEAEKKRLSKPSSDRGSAVTYLDKGQPQ